MLGHLKNHGNIKASQINSKQVLSMSSVHTKTLTKFRPKMCAVAVDGHFSPITQHAALTNQGKTTCVEAALIGS